jgi:hypothetical protein
MRALHIWFVCLVVLGGWAPAAELAVPVGTWSCHGTAILRGQTTAERFWLRLLPPDQKFGGNRVLQVVYSPPPAQALGGTHLADVPFLLLDEQARVVAWNERSGLSQAAPGTTAAATWVVQLDRTPENHTELVSQERQVPGPRGWDRSIAPLLLAMVWRADSSADLPLVDLFGDEPPATCAWKGTQVTLGKQNLTVEADSAGRLKRLVDTSGSPVVVIQEWLSAGQ